MPATQSSSNFSLANGMNKHTCAKWCKFYFQDFFYGIEINKKERYFEIHLKSEVTDLDGNTEKIKEIFDLPYFAEYWGRQFHLIILNKEEVK